MASFYALGSIATQVLESSGRPRDAKASRGVATCRGAPAVGLRLALTLRPASGQKRKKQTRGNVRCSVAFSYRFGTRHIFALFCSLAPAHRKWPQTIF